MLAGIPCAMAEPAGAAPQFGLQHRGDWLGDPYLTTNESGRVSIVLNTKLFETNAIYQGKVNMLVGLENPATNSDWFWLNRATRKANLARLIFAKILPDSVCQSLGLPSADFASRVAGLPAYSYSLPNQPAQPQNQFWLAYFLERWALFIAVAFFLVRRIWRYFIQVEVEDDFADHLATLARAHRWVFWVYMALLTAVAVMEFIGFGNFFFSLSVLILAASLRRYYCEAHFADFPKAQKVHLTLRLLLLWLGWSLGCDHYLSNFLTWFTGPVFAWVLLALATGAFSQFYNHDDVAEHRRELYWFGVGFLTLAILGSTGGYFFWRSTIRYGFPFWICIGSGALIACAPLAGFFRSWSKKVSDAVAGRMLYDMIFSENLFAEKTRKQKRLPSVLLLQHWRGHGEVEKAWQMAQAHLLKEARALSVWMFAMETSVLYRRQPADALNLLKKLCAAEEFHYDHRTVAVAQVQGWMAAGGFPFDPAPFKIERPPLQPSALTDRVEAKCRAGRFGEAVTILLEVLQKDSLNEAAFTQLVRIYCQDLKNRPLAEKLISEAGETFSPKLLNFLGNSLDEWMQLPIRSVVRRRRLLDRLLRRNEPEPAPRKIILTSNPRPAPPKAQDPLEVHLERLKQSQAESRPDTTGVFDHVEKLLLERRLGTAVELLKEQAEADPANFDLWLRYAEAHGDHCGQVFTAEKIIIRMDRSGNFKKAQIKKAYTRLKKWHKKHPLQNSRW